MSASVLPTSLPSPVSTSSGSASPVPPATPLTPSSAHGTFGSQPSNDQFTFDALHLENTTGAVPAQATNGGPTRRKPSRRANTAERRATHNMVERQRREALNGRFLDLAALLPNLASVRRPSKSAIVNSSIALIHTQRRARATAAREVRHLKLEADALRAELNEWRERAGMGLARIEEPIRSREFEELVSGGLEEAEEGLLEEERRALEIVKEGLRLDAGDMDDMMGNQGPFAFNMGNGMYADDDDADVNAQPARLRPGSQGSMNGIPSLQMPISVARHNSMSTPIIFDAGAALLQSHSTHQAGINAFPTYDLSGAPQTHPSLGLAGLQAKQVAANWANPIYSALGQGFHPQQQMFHSPASATAVNFLGGFGLRDDDDASSNHSGSVSDLNINTAFNIHHPGLATHRSRSASSIPKNLNVAAAAGTATPPQSAPATATTYAEAASAAGDVFAAAYNAGFPTSARVAGGGNTYGAALGMFM